MKTKAAVLYETKKPLVFTELETPVLQPGQVLVKIVYTGVCHSQLNECGGLKGEDKYLPHCLGHEAGGIIEEISEGVDKVQVGDHVLVSWINGSGRTIASTQYTDDSGKTINAGAVTTFQEYAVVSENKVTRKNVSPNSSPVRGEVVRRLKKRNAVIPPTSVTNR